MFCFDAAGLAYIPLKTEDFMPFELLKHAFAAMTTLFRPIMGVFFTFCVTSDN
jgi:hypothetical protein